MSTPKPQLVHKTPLVTAEDLLPGHLKPQSYSAEDLSKAIIDLVSTDRAYTERQEQGVAKFRNRGSWNLYEPKNTHDLRVFFDIFNDFFFNGVLAGHCKMGFFEPRPGDDSYSAFCETEYPQFVHDPRYRVERPGSHLAIEKKNKTFRKKYSPEERIRIYQSSLIHEMLHAFFAIYTCICDWCAQKNEGYLLVGNGHEEPWLAAAYAIEQANKTVFEDHEDNDACEDECIAKHAILGLTLGLTFDKENAVASVVHEGADLPPDVDLRRLGIDFKKMWEALKHCRKYKATTYRREQQDRQLMKSNQCVRDYWIVERTAELLKNPEHDLV